MENLNIIYKICTKDEWEEAMHQGSYKGSADDIRDGFIHFSSDVQVQGTLEKHFKDKKNLLILKIDSGKLPPFQLKWEVSRGGEKFPHLYGDLSLDAVIDMEEVPNDR